MHDNKIAHPRSEIGVILSQGAETACLGPVALQYRYLRPDISFFIARFERYASF